MKRFVMAALGVTFLVGVSVGCGGQKGTSSIVIDGSSTVFPVTQRVAEEFEKVDDSVNVSVAYSGTGGGFKKFYGGSTQISNASRPIKDKEAEKCQENGIEYIELPVAYDGIAVVVSKENTWCDYLTTEELKTVFQAGSAVKSWKEVRDGFPDVALDLYAPGRDSGTFDYFTKKINGKEGSGRDENVTASENDDILVRGVSGNKGGLGYFGYAYYEHNDEKLKLIPIQYKGGAPVAPSMETIVQGTYKPLSRPIFIYVRKDAYDKEVHVKKFVDFYMKKVARLVREVGYMPLPGAVYELAKKRLAQGVTDSAYADKDAVKGLTLEQIYARGDRKGT